MRNNLKQLIKDAEVRISRYSEAREGCIVNYWEGRRDAYVKMLRMLAEEY
jgi:hypothetical protein